MIYLLLALVPVIVITSLLVLFYLKLKRKNEKLNQYFKGQTSVFGDYKISYKNVDFHLVRASTMNTSTGFGGSYPLLWIEVSRLANTTVGNINSQKYIYLNGLPSGHVTHEHNFAVAETSELKEHCLNLIKSYPNLFKKDFAHLKVRNEWHLMFEPVFVKRKKILYYVGLPEEIYDDPKILEYYLDGILQFSTRDPQL